MCVHLLGKWPSVFIFHPNSVFRGKDILLKEIFWFRSMDILIKRKGYFLEKILARQTADEDVFRGEIEKVKGLEKSRHCLNNIWFLCGAACDYSGDRPAGPHRSFCPNKPGRTNTVNTDSEQIHLPLSVRNRRCPNTADWEIRHYKL